MKTIGPTSVMLFLLASIALCAGKAAADTAACIQTFHRCVATTPLQGTACANAFDLCKAQDAFNNAKTTSDSSTKLKDAGALGAGRLELHTDPIKAPANANANADKCAAAMTNGASILPPGCSLGAVTVKKDPSKVREGRLQLLYKQEKEQRARDYAQTAHAGANSIGALYGGSGGGLGAGIGEFTADCFDKTKPLADDFQKSHICNFAHTELEHELGLPVHAYRH